MKPPAKHHFSPAFALQPWTGADGLVCQMRKVDARVAPRRIHPNATGFEVNLYQTEGLPPDQEQHLEENFMKPIDTAAHQALKKMLSGDPTPWSSELRSGWTRYLLSLRFRTPAAVRSVKRHMLEMWNEGMRGVEAKYEQWRHPDDPPTFEEFAELTDPAAPGISATNLLIHIIDNARVGPTIFNMDWSVIRTQDAKVSLMTSDNPLDWPVGLSDPKAYIGFAIAPDAIFVASNDPRMKSWVSARPHTEIAKSLNKVVVSQANEFVWGQDDRQLPFVHRHFASAPVKPIISPEQRAAAISAGLRGTGPRSGEGPQ